MTVDRSSPIVHVGLQKTASTSLQQLVFPLVARLRGDVVFNDAALTKLLGNFGDTNAMQREEDDFRSLLNSARHFISMETLAGGIPESWEQRAESNLRLFGPRATIILTLRRTEAWLRSVYQQIVMKGYVLSAESFFLRQEGYNRIESFLAPKVLTRFNVDSFDLERLHQLYCDRFESVFLVPYEQIGRLDFLDKIFDLTEGELAKLRTVFATGKRHNRAYSSTAMKLTLGREKFLDYFGLASRYNTEDRISRSLASEAHSHPPPHI